MSLHDFRTKPESQWTYYVVDHLPSMANIYRYDTPEEAIACYWQLNPCLRSAIGSSIGGIHELDHIHRCSGDTSVLVTASDLMETPLWRDSSEIQAAIDLMVEKLNVHNERNSIIFGGKVPSVVVPLERGIPRPLDSYFRNSILYASIPNQSQSAIDEVYVMSHGWMNLPVFHRLLQDCRPGRNGEGQKDLFVERLSVRYLDLRSGYSGLADISPQQYGLLNQRTKEELAPEKLAADLDTLLLAYSPDPSYGRHPSEDRLSSLREQIASGKLREYRAFVASCVNDRSVPCALQEVAASLQRRFLALTPIEFRRSALMQQIKTASQTAEISQYAQTEAPEREEVR